MPSHSCGTRELRCRMWDLVPGPGIEPGPLRWEQGVLTTGSPGKSLLNVFNMTGNVLNGLYESLNLSS